MNRFCLTAIFTLLIIFSLTTSFAAEAATLAQKGESSSMLVKSLKPLKLSGLNCGSVNMDSLSKPEAGTPEELLELLAKQPAFVCLGKNILKEGCKNAYLKIERDGGLYFMLTKKKGKSCTLVQEMRDDAANLNGATKDITVRTTCSVSAMNKNVTKQERLIMKSPGMYISTILYGTLFVNAFTLMGLDSNTKAKSSSKDPCVTKVILR